MRFSRFVFGLRSSTIRNHLEAQELDEFKTELVEIVKNFLYVDDLVTGEESEEEAFELYSKSKETMCRGGSNLRKWKTNSRVVQDMINRSNDCATQTPVTKGTKAIIEKDKSYA